MTIQTLPPYPQRSDPPEVFAAKGDAFVAAQNQFVTDVNATAAQVQANADAAAQKATDATTQAGNAATQAAAASASAASASAASGVVKWVAGSYAAGACAWSPTNGQTYRNLTAGTRNTDPASDPTNWVLLGSFVPSIAAERAVRRARIATFA